tara:strand:+ start:3428 stop:4594 length:1167 start_codon:yes stop_codon:yes gene_type:complete
MGNASAETRYSPLIILTLLAALVAALGLWAREVSTGGAHNGNHEAQAAFGAERYTWKLVTTWPRHLPGLGLAAENFAQYVEAMSGGRLIIRVYGAGEIVPAMEVFDAVSQGVADAGHGAAYYWKGKIPSAVFFTAVPFGMNAQEMNGWLHYGGGLDLWRQAYAPHNLVPFAGGSTGVQMAGWFNREINSIDDLKGLKMRIPGLAGEVFAAAGGTAVRIAGGELYTAMQTGVIDALEWVGPYNDLAFGFQEVARYYYYPGWHEPGAMLEFIVNRQSLEALPEDLQAIVRHAARAVNQDMLDEYTARNNAALTRLVNEHDVQLRRLPDDVLRALWVGTRQALDELVEDDPLAASVYASYRNFYNGARSYHHISEQSYTNVRDTVLGDEAY